MFDINQYPFDADHGYLSIGGEAMIFHCHHYINYLQRSILDADYIDSRRFLIGSAADAVRHQLKNLCQELDVDEAKTMAEEVYKTFGYGLIDLSSMNEDGIELTTQHSFFSKTWLMKFGVARQTVDYYTSGYLAAVYSVLYDIPLEHIFAEQTTCMAKGDTYNTHVVRKGKGNFSTYSSKHPTRFKEVPKQRIGWEYEELIVNAFLGAHTNFVGNEDGLIPAFGVYIVRNQSDYVNRLQFEFMHAMREIAGEYGETLARELLLEAGHACGFFTYGGIMTSQEWNTVVKPYLKTPEDWIKGLLSLINTMGWGYHTVIELSPDKAVFRNYNDFEDLSYMRMYGESDFPIHWANSGGFTGLMQLIYNTGLVAGSPLETEEGFKQMRREKKARYHTRQTKGISCGNDYLEVEVYR